MSLAPYPAVGSASETSAGCEQEGGPCGRDCPQSLGAAEAASQVRQEGKHFQTRSPHALCTGHVLARLPHTAALGVGAIFTVTPK